jgi:hypothetical protein
MVGDMQRRRRHHDVPESMVQQVLRAPAVRPGAVARVRRQLAARLLPPPPRVVAASVVDVLVAERRGRD